LSARRHDTRVCVCVRGGMKKAWMGIGCRGGQRSRCCGCVCMCGSQYYSLCTVHYTTPHCTTLHYTTLHHTRPALHCTTLHYTRLHHTRPALHCTTLHYTTPHYTTPYIPVKREQRAHGAVCASQRRTMATLVPVHVCLCMCVCGCVSVCVYSCFKHTIHTPTHTHTHL
jgi:hypothetical protein